MALDRDSNGYTIGFATIMVVIVAGLLTFISMSLKPLQQANVRNEKMQNILQATGMEETNGIERDAAGAVFNDFIIRRLTIDFNGNILSDKSSTDAVDPKDPLDAFNIDMRKEYSKFIKPILNKYKGDIPKIKEELGKSKDIHFPLFVSENNGKKVFVVSFSGKGLWDDIWGYMGLSSDGKTINGTVFDHKAETPGLGSKITEQWFNDQFKGKTISNDEGTKFVLLKVLKPGNDLNESQVDGISGATFTGVGVDEMLGRNLRVYFNFFKKMKEENNPLLVNK